MAAGQPAEKVTERRRHARKKGLLEAHYELEGRRHRAGVADLGKGGLSLVDVRQPLRVGERLVVWLTLSRRSGAALSLPGRIIWVQQQGVAAWRAGVEFDRLDPAAQRALSFYLWN